MPAQQERPEVQTIQTIRTKTVKYRLTQVPLVVSGNGFRCLAYRDRKGDLRNFWSQGLVPLPVHILDPEF